MGGVPFRIRPQLDQSVRGGDSKRPAELVGGGFPGGPLDQGVHPQQGAAAVVGGEAEPVQDAHRITGVLAIHGPPEAVPAESKDRPGGEQAGGNAVGIQQGGDL